VSGNYNPHSAYGTKATVVNRSILEHRSRTIDNDNDLNGWTWQEAGVQISAVYTRNRPKAVFVPLDPIA
jgi:hypothetical protein